jgi:hypothetical protein
MLLGNTVEIARPSPARPNQRLHLARAAFAVVALDCVCCVQWPVRARDAARSLPRR